MVIEHVFVTTLESDETMRRAAAFLQSGGFESNLAAFPVGGEWKSIEVRRGKKNAGRAKSISQLPQQVRLDWDRGRVTVALSIGANAAWGGGGAFAITSSGGTVGNPKKMKLHSDLLVAIASGLERLLASQEPPEVAKQGWDLVEQQIAEAARKRRRRNWIFAGVLLAIVCAAIVLIIFAANS